MENQRPTSDRPRRWPLFLIGFLLVVAGPVIYVVQMQLQNLAMPWYVPGLATLGVLCMALSVKQRRGVWRIVGLALFGLLCGLEWQFLISQSKTPPYAGPDRPGRKVSEFAAAFADGKKFSNADLEDGQRTALVFFRGRW
jgi:hypothetical protein